jgi:hypothetical protein
MHILSVAFTVQNERLGLLGLVAIVIQMIFLYYLVYRGLIRITALDSLIHEAEKFGTFSVLHTLRRVKLFIFYISMLTNLVISYLFIPYLVMGRVISTIPNFNTGISSLSWKLVNMTVSIDMHRMLFGFISVSIMLLLALVLAALLFVIIYYGFILRSFYLEKAKSRIRGHR